METLSDRGRDLEGRFSKWERGKGYGCGRDQTDCLGNGISSASKPMRIDGSYLTLKGAKMGAGCSVRWASLSRFAGLALAAAAS